MATKKLQGITIEIDGNTTKLSDSLKQVNKDLYSVNSELKDVERALKLDPSNIELWKQKQTLLNDAISNTEAKLQQLNTAKNQMDSDDSIDKESADYRELVREISNAEAKLKDLNSQQSTASKNVDDLSDGIEDASTNLKDASNNASTFGDMLKANVIGDAITSGLKEIANLTKEVAKAFVDILKDGVEYNAEMETYTKSITAMLNGDSESAQDLVNNMKELASASSFDSTSLMKASQYLLSAGVNAEDTQKTIEALGNAIAYTGGGTDELERMAQNLQQIQNVGKASSADIKQFAMAGIDVYGILAEQLGVTTEQVKDMDVTFEDLSLALQSASEDGGRYFGAMETQANTLSGQLALTESSFKELTGYIASDATGMLQNEFLPVINDTIQAMSEGMQKDGVEGMMSALKEGLKQMIALIVKELPNFVKEGMSIISSLIDGFIDSFDDLSNGIDDVIQVLVDSIIDLLPKIIDVGIDLIIALANGIVKALPTLISKAPEIISKVAKTLVEALPSIVEVGKNLITGIWEGIGNTLQWLKDKIKELGISIVDSVKSALGIHSPSKVMKEQVGLNIAKGIGQGILEGIPQITDQVDKAMSQLNHDVQTSVNPTINPTANSNPLILQIENFNNTRNTDIQALAEELEYYRKNSALAYGGN